MKMQLTCTQHTAKWFTILSLFLCLFSSVFVPNLMQLIELPCTQSVGRLSRYFSSFFRRIPQASSRNNSTLEIVLCHEQATINIHVCEFSGSQAGEDKQGDLVGCDPISTFTQVPMFRRNKEVLYISETSVPISMSTVSQSKDHCQILEQTFRHRNFVFPFCFHQLLGFCLLQFFYSSFLCVYAGPETFFIMVDCLNCFPLNIAAECLELGHSLLYVRPQSGDQFS